jgi:hypothetical protein
MWLTRKNKRKVTEERVVLSADDHREVQDLLAEAKRERAAIVRLAHNLTRRIEQNNLAEDLSKVLRRDR